MGGLAKWVSHLLFPCLHSVSHITPHVHSGLGPDCECLSRLTPQNWLTERSTALEQHQALMDSLMQKKAHLNDVLSKTQAKQAKVMEKVWDVSGCGGV